MDQHWDDLVKHFCSVSDGLGMPIDDEIFDTVIALNALGIRRPCHALAILPGMMVIYATPGLIFLHLILLLKT